MTVKRLQTQQRADLALAFLQMKLTPLGELGGVVALLAAMMRGRTP